MKPIWYVSLFASVILVYSCKKDNAHLDAPSVYHKSKKEGQTIKVYSSNGEINYTYIVDRFLQLDSGLISNVAYNLASVDSIRIIDGANAKLFGYGYNNYTYIATGKDIRFFSIDTLYGYSSGEILTRSWTYQVSVFKPVVYREYITSSTAGNYLFGYVGKREVYAYVDDGKLVIPWYVLLIHNGQPNSKIFTLQNRLVPEFYKLIAPKDTVVMREFRQALEK